MCDEYRTLIECPYCEQAALTSAPVEFCTRRLHAFTTHIRLEHDFVVYPSTRDYTYQQLVGGRRAHAAQQWMHSDRVYQEREDAKKIRHHWHDRKIIRADGSDKKNGNIQPILYTPIDTMAEHVCAPRATPAPQPNKHLMVRDDYPEVVGAESSALPGRNIIPKDWSRGSCFMVHEDSQRDAV